MKLLEFREYINTECSSLSSPILSIQAIKIDDNKTKKNLKQQLGCKNLKSCDYVRRGKNTLFFLELSDFHWQLENLKKKSNDTQAHKMIKDEVRLKLSETLLLHHAMLKKFTFKEKNKALKMKALLAVCKENGSDVVVFSKLERELSKYYCPTHLSSIKVIPYTELENIF